jgi:hypothetical protein
MLMTDLPKDLFTEPADIDPDTLANLGPLRRLAGVWEGRRGVDLAPKAAGPERSDYVERIEMQPTDPQANGPQLFYGLAYHIHILKPGEDATFHDQVGYWLWEPATGMVLQTLAIPRGQVALAGGYARPGDNTITVRAERGSTQFGIASQPFLEKAFRTDAYSLTVTFNDDGTWGYDSQTMLAVHGRFGLFNHRDRNILTRIAEPTPNPLAGKAR